MWRWHSQQRGHPQAKTWRQGEAGRFRNGAGTAWPECREPRLGEQATRRALHAARHQKGALAGLLKNQARTAGHLQRRAPAAERAVAEDKFGKVIGHSIESKWYNLLSFYENKK